MDIPSFLLGEPPPLEITTWQHTEFLSGQTQPTNLLLTSRVAAAFWVYRSWPKGLQSEVYIPLNPKRLTNGQSQSLVGQLLFAM